MFEALVRDIAQRFGLGDKAGDLLGELLSLIFDEKNGGVAGLLAKFRQQGLGDVFGSWLGGTQPKPIEPGTVEAVLGSDTVSGIANRLGIARGTAVAATAAMLPKLIGLLTPGGQLPSGIPAAASAYLGAFRGSGDDAARLPTPPAPSAGTPGWLKWLVLAVVVLALGWCMVNRTPEAPAPASSDRAVPTAPTQALPQAEPTLSLANEGGKASYSGRVGAEADRARIAEALNAAFGTGNTDGSVSIDTNTKPAGWLAALDGLLPAFAKAPGAKLEFDGRTITLGGSPSDGDRANLADLLRRLYAGYTLNGLEPGVAQNARDALKSLLPGKYSAAELVKALNLMTIHFDSGSDAISADSLDVLGDAAAALKNAPAGTKVEIGGHTDNTGDTAANLKLSEARANAVRAKLIELGVPADVLVANGYGDSRPVADNATEEGRAKNRRMEFTVVE